MNLLADGTGSQGSLVADLRTCEYVSSVVIAEVVKPSPPWTWAEALGTMKLDHDNHYILDDVAAELEASADPWMHAQGTFLSSRVMLT